MSNKRIAAAIKKEEDRQIQAGIRDTLERNMTHNRSVDNGRHLYLVKGGKAA